MNEAQKKDLIYRALWLEYVIEDVRAYCEGTTYTLSDDQIAEAAQRYVDGDYDCNKSYWDNIEDCIESILDNEASRFKPDAIPTIEPNTLYVWFENGDNCKFNTLCDNAFDALSEFRSSSKLALSLVGIDGNILSKPHILKLTDAKGHLLDEFHA